MNVKRFGAFAGKVTAAHVTTYSLAGALAYNLLTKDFYTGPNPIFAAFMRTEAEPALWAHVVRWFLPAQILRGLLMAAVLYPLYLVLGFWGAAVAAPGTIEGMVYMRPFITPEVHLRVQPEIVGQGLALAFLIAGAMMEAPRSPHPAR
jgi:hypothetical protein